jgi:hypothetical protein
MSTFSLPSYTREPLQTPLYSPEPLLHERRISRGRGHPFATRPSNSAEFVKDSKKGSLRLRLSGQESNVAIPVFGIRGPIEGTLEVLKPEGLAFVAVRVRVPRIPRIPRTHPPQPVLILIYFLFLIHSGLKFED